MILTKKAKKSTVRSKL